MGAACQDTFGSYEEAVQNLCYFDGTKTTEEEVYVTDEKEVKITENMTKGITRKYNEIKNRPPKPSPQCGNKEAK